jgi:glycosidase
MSKRVAVLRGTWVLAALFACVLAFSMCAEAPPPDAPSAPAAPAAAGTVAVTFTHAPEGTPGALYLAGSFNDWDPSRDLMTDDDGDGIYAVALALEPGTYQYKFVADGAWMEDPAAKEYTDDGYGGKNSVVTVPGDVAELVVGVGAGTVAAAAPKKKIVHDAAGAVPVHFIFETGEGVTAAVYVAGTFNGWDPAKDLMTDDDGDGVYEFTTELKPGRYEYKFVRDGQWLTDESAMEFADDGFGGKNSVLQVPATAPEGGLIVGAAGALPAGVTGEKVGREPGAEEALKEVVFRFQPKIGGFQNVFLAGTFNDWNDSKTRMTDDDGDGAFEVVLMLPVGRYQYKFVADGQWITDETAKDFAPDGFGGQNSVIVVDASFADVHIEMGDGEIMYRDIPLVLDYAMVNPSGRNTIEFKARAHRDDIESIHLLYVVDGGAEMDAKMSEDELDATFQYYKADLDVPASSQIDFTFKYADGPTVLYMTPSGFEAAKPAAANMFRYTDEIIKPFFTPEWAKDGVFYQIFPERFRNGDTLNDPDFTEPYYAGVTTLPASGKTNGEYFHLVRDWNNISGLSKSPYRTDGKPDYYSFYGGDIAGVMEKIPYLADLGVTIIYFNPLNQARSNHKYDPMDYCSIDPHFADEETFKAFVKKSHEHGIRIIVDMAFNHTGDWHFAFVDSKEKGRESKYWNWYEWKRWPIPAGGVSNPIDYYDCWWGFGIHPVLNYDLSRSNADDNNVTDINDAEPNWDVVNYVLGCTRKWLGDFDIDGFRLDVPNEVPFWFWYEFRKVVDEVEPDAFLIGEIWGNAMPWLGPQCFHSTMNYKFFRDPVLKFFGLGQGTAAQFDREIAPGRSIYPLQATQVMMNLIDSHDTERFVTTAGSDDKLMLAALFQMTYVGIPQIYYGDEVGLRGGKDPDCRRPFPWGWEESPRRTKIHDFYKKITGIRRAYPALRTGTFTTVLTEGKVYGFLRKDEANTILVVLNNENASRDTDVYLDTFGIPNGTAFADELNGGTYTVDEEKIILRLGAKQGAILVMQ